jgi:Xaa-Pro aminopeptidase
VLGAATEAQRADAQRAGDTVQAMQAAAREGVAVGAVAEAARASLGADDLVRSAAAYGLGHGIGLDLEESPTIRPGAAETLPSGATLGLHVVLPGGIAARTLHVTGDAAINLTTTASEPLVECGGREP